MILGLSMVRSSSSFIYIKNTVTNSLELDVRSIRSRLGPSNDRTLLFSTYFPRLLHSELIYRYCLTCTVVIASEAFLHGYDHSY